MSLLLLIIGLLLGLALGLLVGLALGRARTATLEARAKTAEDKASYVENQLADRFQALSAEALDANNRRFLELADTRLEAANSRATNDLDQRKQAVEHLVAPLRETLAKVETQLRESETGRRTSQAELAKQVDVVRQSSEELRQQTQSLVTALRRPEARGRWGELQLRRVVEIAGMSHYCDFDEQASADTADGTVRPDMVIRLTGGKNVVVDSKVSLAAYLDAAETSDGDTRAARLDAHARHLRDHVDRLASKTYWAAFTPAPEFVVLFIPGEAFLAPALERDPGLLEHAMSRRVHIATPTTLITMLRTAHYAWQQAALSDNARQVFDLGKEMYDRLSTLGQHVDGLGKVLTNAVKTYNKTVASLETRVLVSARKLNELGVVEDELASPRSTEETVRSLSAPELIDDAAQARPVRVLPVDGERAKDADAPHAEEPDEPPGPQAPGRAVAGS